MAAEGNRRSPTRRFYWADYQASRPAVLAEQPIPVKPDFSKLTEQNYNILLDFILKVAKIGWDSLSPSEKFKFLIRCTPEQGRNLEALGFVYEDSSQTLKQIQRPGVANSPRPPVSAPKNTNLSSQDRTPRTRYTPPNPRFPVSLHPVLEYYDIKSYIDRGGEARRYAERWLDDHPYPSYRHLRDRPSRF